MKFDQISGNGYLVKSPSGDYLRSLRQNIGKLQILEPPDRFWSIATRETILLVGFYPSEPVWHDHKVPNKGQLESLSGHFWRLSGHFT